MSTLPNVRTTSTTFEVETVKIRRPVRAKESVRSSGRGWWGLPRRDWRRPVTLQVQYRHGADPKVKVTARGREWVYDWDVALLDVVSDVNNRQGW
jgi:hypothetical protein